MKSPTFCVLPYHCWETSGQTLENIHCCRWQPGTDAESVREAIAQGQRHAACQSCWAAEDQGVTSEREIHNRTLDWIMDTDIETLCDRALAGDRTIHMIKLYTSNICNGTCVTCGPHSSTAWQELSGWPIHYEQQDTMDLDWTSVRYLSLVGGEPLLERRNWRLLEKIAAAGNTDLFVTIVTNGNATISQANLELLGRFTNLNFCLSVDGVGPVFDYMRYPLKWDTLLTTLDRLRTVTGNISLSTMVSNINIYFLDDIDHWARSSGLAVAYKAVTWPQVFQPANLPLALQQLARENSVLAQPFLIEHRDDWRLLQQEIQRQDDLKKISIEHYLGDWGRLLKGI